MSEHWKRHECDKLPDHGVQVIYSMDNVNRKTKTWRLIIRREATSDDLEDNPILEEEGQTLWETSLEIMHCPYCGDSLLDVKDEIFEDLGKYVHTDYSAWHVRRQ
ncbi:MAG: hypothetical protein ABIK28_11965 [Planctomycetota bacterium]